ncbi:MAG: hypothetical protein AB7E80_03150 [Hyphomicrobiaceae bacterium]
MSVLKRLTRLTTLGMACAALLAAVPTADAKEFTVSERANPRLARKLGIPVYFALPPSARLPITSSIETSDVLVDFQHPDAKPGSNIGLRTVETRRSGMAARLGRSGIVQTGDLLLTFRPEWGGAGAYPNIQMGISHAGLAFVKDGVVHNLDNPLNEEYLGRGMRADLTSSHYATLKFIHVIRPRGLTEQERANIVAWSTRFTQNARKIYPQNLKFNQDYNAPKYSRFRSLEFVKRVGQIGLGVAQSEPLDLYCSEFAWSVLALRKCDPAKTKADFEGRGTPSCIDEIMTPLDATGNNISRQSRRSYIGLVDGPLTVIDSMKLPDEDRVKTLNSLFDEHPDKLSKMSVGHRTVAKDLQPKFEKLRGYYLGVTSKSAYDRLKARLVRSAFNASTPDNYSPTSFLINTLLPVDNNNRKMDYVATIVID